MQSEYDFCMVMQNIAQEYVTKYINKTDERESPQTNYKKTISDKIHYCLTVYYVPR